MYHVDVLSGVICECKLGRTCPIEPEEHSSDYMELIRTYEANNNMRLYSHDFFKYSDEFQFAMEKASKNGFTRGGVSEIEIAQVDLLLHREAIESLIDFIYQKKNGSFKNKLIRVTSWAISEYSKNNGVEVKKVFDLFANDRLSDRDLNSLKMAIFSGKPSLDELLSISATLWMFDYSPYRALAKYLIFGGDYALSGYTPQDVFTITVYNNDDYYSEFSIDSEALVKNVVAFDIETDTSRGFGLLPHNTQITEIVLSTHDKTTVISGDEKRILEYVRDYFNLLDDGVRIIGWNNECFDNIVLQTRAEFHSINGWRGVLYPVENDTIFEPCGPTSQACGFRWNNGEKSNLAFDIFQIKLRNDKKNGIFSIPGLKNFVEEHGCTPLKVDRANLHLLSDVERNLYSLSDGLCTLYAYSIIFKELGGNFLLA